MDFENKESAEKSNKTHPEFPSLIEQGGKIDRAFRLDTVDETRDFLKTQEEILCGKCIPCRDGIYQMRLILDRIIEGDGQAEDITTLEWMGTSIVETSLCNKGRTVSSRFIESLRNLKNQYTSLIREDCPDLAIRN